MHAVLPCIAALLVSASTPAEPRHDPEPPTGAWDDEPEATQGDAESAAALTLERDGADAVPALVAALRAESPYDAGSVIASDARFVRLTHAERARLLGSSPVFCVNGTPREAPRLNHAALAAATSFDFSIDRSR
ncbi:hypothetical protein [Anaeromyxobacter sp. SG64]|uniref:hypothetical protein n=1 Tax=Anaeromyxobacter sp. SG64 TaxID=2925409 RepID=UPI001F56EC35|nr:hypothetical protein [Anaeromyxobacter sp. SG64]